MPPFTDPTDTIETKLTSAARLNIARAVLGDISFIMEGFALGRYGYLDTNPVKIVPITDPTNNAGANILIINNTFDVGDRIFINGIRFEVNVQWDAGVTLDESATNLANAINLVMNTNSSFTVGAEAVGALVSLFSIIPGSYGNTFTLSKVDHSTSNFNLSGGTFTGGTDGQLIDKIFPNALPVIPSNPTALRSFRVTSGAHDGPSSSNTLYDSTKSWTIDYYVGQLVTNLTDGSRGLVTSNTDTAIYMDLCKGTNNVWNSGDEYLVGIEKPIPSSVSAICRIELSEGLWGYGEIATYARVIKSNISSEVDTLFMMSLGHFPLLSKTDKNIMIFRMIVTT